MCLGVATLCNHASIPATKSQINHADSAPI
jgi:hypothetical protein